MAKAQILIVEDDFIVAEDIQDRLENLDFEVSGRVSSGEEAINNIRDKNPDLVLMDIVLYGEMDGIETAQIIRTEFNIPVVYLTAYAQEETLQRAKITEPFGYIIKPFQDRELTSVVEIALYKHKAENRLRESGQLNQMLLDSLPHPAMLIDRHRTVIAANKIALEIGTYIGKFCWQTFGHSLSIPEEHKCYITDHNGTIPPGGTQCTFCLADQSLKELKSANAEVTVEGAIYDTCWVPVKEDLFLHYAIDITEKRKMEKKLQHTQKMEAIGTLAGGIAHDFNNILYPIIGFTEMMLDDAPEGSDFRENLNEVLTASFRATDLVQQILTFSRQAEKERKPLKTQIIIREVLKLIRASLPSTIAIEQHIDKNCGMVLADPTHIHQIAMNIMTNAFHAMEEDGGTLTIALSEEIISVEDLKNVDLNPGTFVHFSVSDTGHGIEKHFLNRIFEPYFTTKDQGKGTGLGLSVVHGIVKSYKGDIRVYSEPGKGSVFNVYLPVIDSTREEAKPIMDHTPVQGGDEHILLVDDEEPILKMEKKMLEHLGYQVTSRTSSTEALKAFRSTSDRFDLVITDMTMPNMTGEKLTFEFKNIRKEIPVILCTGFSEKISKEKADTLGIDGFLMKPIVKSELSQTIRAVLDSKKGG